MKPTFTYISYLLFVALLMGIIIGCARQASPEGGPYDMIPPKLVRSVPVNEATNITSKKIKLRFNENVKVEKQNEKLFFSPPQQTPPRILQGTGKTITVIYEDDLKPHTTYTINFTDAIVDLNENNPLEGFVFAFSTGSSIDTMQIRGKVIDAQSLAPVPNILVGVHPDGSDTLFQKRPFVRVAQTDGEGGFTITHLAPGSYRLFALNDLDHSFSYSQRSEGFGVAEQLVTAVSPLVQKREEVETRVQEVESATDTLPATKEMSLPTPSMTDSIRTDSIAQKDSIALQQEDAHLNLLLYSVDVPKKQFLQKGHRPDSLRLVFNFNAPIDSLPKASLLDLTTEAKELSLLQLNEERTEATYWIADPTLYQRDTLNVQIRYNAIDSLEQTYMQTDTLSLIHRKKEVRNRSLLKGINRDSQNSSPDSLQKDTETSPIHTLTVEQKKSKRWYKDSPRDTIQFAVNEPIDRIDTTRIHLYSVKDSIETPEPFSLRKIPLNPCGVELITNYNYGIEYKLVVDSAAIESIYSGINSKSEIPFSIQSEDKFGAVQLSFPELPLEGIVYIDLLTSKNETLATFQLKDSILQISDLPPASYFARMWIDLNDNHVWDPASYPKRRAEPVYFYPQALSVQAKFTSEEVWLFNKLPLEKQRPSGMESPFGEVKNNQQGRREKNLNEEYIQRMRERYGDKWNPSNRDRKILGLPTRAEEKAQKAEEKEEKEKGGKSKEKKGKTAP